VGSRGHRRQAFRRSAPLGGDLAVGLRWTDPFWTGSLAASTGLSLASSLPATEELIDPPTRKLLHFIRIEAAFALWDRSDREFVFGLHHRSSAFGSYGTHNGGLNFLAIGYRLRF
jgi:hypothetical protein